MDARRQSGWLLILAAVWLPAIIGCGPSRAETVTAARLKQLATLYLDFAITQNGAGPANEAVLKNHIRRLDAVQLQAAGLDLTQLDGLFTSERDGETFVIRYGTELRDISGQSAPLLIYEQQGRAGKHLVAYGNAQVKELSAAELKAALQ